MEQGNDEKIKEFVHACHKTAACGLLRCSSGNMSCRLNEELVALSVSRTWLAELGADEVAICRLEDGRCINDKTATVEKPLHLGILRDRNDVNVVLHFQSPFATAIACGRPQDYNFSIIIEVPYYIGDVGIVEYLPPGSAELAEAVVSAMKKHDLVILRNHGLVAAGRDFKEVIEKASFFELACQVLLCQDKLEFLSQKAIDKLKNM
ncbi:MAG: class II aldolase/adducin family protein [Planctomycetota bacterium]|jgi:ribulose-5-phosphate 4-epimerase/fuculose-1-phosphate aldolase